MGTISMVLVHRMKLMSCARCLMLLRPFSILMTDCFRLSEAEDRRVLCCWLVGERLFCLFILGSSLDLETGFTGSGLGGC